jgi:hypothetical protein
MSFVMVRVMSVFLMATAVIVVGEDASFQEFGFGRL